MVVKDQQNLMYYYQRPDIDEMYLYVKDPFELKYQLLINGREKVGIKKLVLDYTNWWCLWKFRTQNPTKKRKVFIVFDDMTADMECKKIKTHSHWIVFRRKKTQHFTCSYITILLQSA